MKKHLGIPRCFLVLERIDFFTRYVNNGDRLKLFIMGADSQEGVVETITETDEYFNNPEFLLLAAKIAKEMKGEKMIHRTERIWFLIAKAHLAEPFIILPLPKELLPFLKISNPQMSEMMIHEISFEEVCHYAKREECVNREAINILINVYNGVI